MCILDPKLLEQVRLGCSYAMTPKQTQHCPNRISNSCGVEHKARSYWSINQPATVTLVLGVEHRK